MASLLPSLLELDRCDRGELRVDLIEDLHQHAGHGHQDEIAIDDVAELVRDHGALLLLAQELEDALGDHDARIRAQQAVGEGGRVAVGDEADPGRLEAIVAGHLMDELVNAGIALLDRRVVEELELIEPAERQVGEPRADQPDEEIDDHGERDGDGEIDLAGRHHGGEHAADHHADQDAEGDERRKEETCHEIPQMRERAGKLSLSGVYAPLDSPRGLSFPRKRESSNHCP